MGTEKPGLDQSRQNLAGGSIAAFDPPRQRDRDGPTQHFSIFCVPLDKRYRGSAAGGQAAGTGAKSFSGK